MSKVKPVLYFVAAVGGSLLALALIDRLSGGKWSAAIGMLATPAAPSVPTTAA